MTQALDDRLGERASGGHPGAARLGAALAALGVAATPSPR
jgi:hypothetical protein